MAVAAGLLAEKSFPECGQAVSKCNRYRRFCLLPIPPTEFLRWLSDNPDTHPGVLSPAKFAAGPQIEARFFNLQPQMVGLSGNDVHFLSKIGHPPTVNHIS